ncbi:MAG: glycoside hydrolase family 113 [Terriglobia bacterium]
MVPDTLEKASSGVEANAATGRAFLQAWLACAAFYFPIFWISTSLVRSARGLVRLVFFGGRLTGARLSPFSAYLIVGFPRNPGNAHPQWAYPNSAWMVLVVVLVAVLLVMLVAKQHRLLDGLALGTLGNTALVMELSPRVLASRHFPGVWPTFSAVVYIAVLAIGLRWMITGWPASESLRSYHGRVTILASVFVLLPLLLFCGLRFSSGFFVSWLEVLVTPAAIGAVVVSLWPVRKPREPRRNGWKSFSFGLVATCLMIFGIQQGARAIDNARTAAIHQIMAAYPPVDPNAPYPKLFFQKGVNFTVEGPDGYSSAGGRHILESLPQYGVNAVALVPYGFTRRGRSPTVGFGGWERDDQMRVAARVAHARGMKVMLKPAMWDAISLQFQSPEERHIWFEQYQTFLEHYARLATEIHADIFCIGGEFTHLSQYDAQWRPLIAQVREIYPGPLVYAANFGQEFETVKFWDALDYIGLQEYYPLPDDLDASSVMEEVESVQQRFGKPVIFTEVGFSSVKGTNRAPWDDSGSQKIDLGLQVSCYQAIFRVFYAKPWFEGMYWWRIGSDGDGGPQNSSFTPWDKPAMNVVKRWYTEGGR